ncbi:MAG: efflux RND transporter periplasmic adaptor subunit [Roseiarcus sp.]|jgi:RND family efflux transporter MFP subunit
MRRLTNWLLLLLALAAAALGAAEQLAAIRTPLPPPAFGVIAAVCAGLLVIRILPSRARRAVVLAVALAVIVALTGGLAYFQFVFKPNMIKGAISAASAPKPTSVVVEAARIEKWPPQLTAIGTLRAYQGVAIAPQVGGVVAAIHFESGDDVEAGAPLVDIDDSVEQADLANGLAQLKNANVTLERAKTLNAGGNAPQSTVDAAIAARDSAAATVQHTRAVIAQKAIKAPFAGRLGLRNVDLGQYVPVGASLTTLQRLDPIYVDFPAPEEALASLAVGDEATMTVDALPGRSFTGRVMAIDARVSAESRNVFARAQFANPDRKLLPGMFANVTVTTGASADVLTLPRTAIVYSLYGDTVFVVEPAPAPSGQAPAAGAQAAAGGASGLIVERRFVRVGATRGERVAIEEGIKAGERAVTAGQIKLQANSPVAIDESGALPPPAQTPKP